MFLMLVTLSALLLLLHHNTFLYYLSKYRDLGAYYYILTERLNKILIQMEPSLYVQLVKKVFYKTKWSGLPSCS